MRANTALEETQRCLDNIERFDGQVNAFISVLSETALEEARAMDMALQRGEEQGLLAGVPISVKDCIDVAGVKCTNGSRFFQDHMPRNDAMVVQR
jgi:aspartyl-tRNA(Asn)/glutamyl-tRNA(Gln) amidotransferase subunit A